MYIHLSPIQYDAPLTLERLGDVLLINEEPFDFSAIPDGGLLPRDAIKSDYIMSDVERINGEITLTLLLPYQFGAPEHVRFPTEPYHLDTARKVIFA